MKSRMRRLAAVVGGEPTAALSSAASTVHTSVVPVKPAELSWPDYLTCLLTIAAEIEHGLMVEYLYAAYSLGGEQVPPRHQPMVERWRNNILTIAREEMGHLLTVQNLLCFLGRPVSFDREDYPWDTPFYPFPFRLEPLSIASLSCYVYAEMPADLDAGAPAGRPLPPRYREFLRRDKARIYAEVRKVARGEPHRVGTIYDQVIAIISDRTRIPDGCFNPATLERQASWDDWGRGYRPGPRYVDAEGSLLKPASSRGARVIVAQVVTRTQAIQALKDVAGQGEAPHLSAPGDEPSHFDRFLEIYQEFERLKGWSPVRNVPVNPTSNAPGASGEAQSPIETQPARIWANLFNVRYRMLLTYLSHVYRLPSSRRPDEPNLRGTVIHRAFGEMYNLKTIAGLLMTMPLAGARSSKRAGPPFEMPYSLELPEREADCWELHRDLLATSDDLRRTLLASASGDGARYLNVLGDIDAQALAWIDQVLAGLGATKRHSA